MFEFCKEDIGTTLENRIWPCKECEGVTNALWGVVLMWKRRMHVACHGWFPYQRIAAYPCQCWCILGLELPDY